MDKGLLEMIKKVFMDFGVGKNFHKVKHYALKNYYIIVIDKKSGTYDEYDEVYNINKHFVDKRIIGDWNNDYDIPKIDVWSCTSCFEHIIPENVEASIHGIIKKIKKNSTGTLSIDLSDHLGGFNHYDDNLYKSKKYNSSYLNRIKCLEWKNIFFKYFIFDYTENFFEDNISNPRNIVFSKMRLNKNGLKVIENDI